jgi:hypothetical protein
VRERQRGDEASRHMSRPIITSPALVPIGRGTSTRAIACVGDFLQGWFMRGVGGAWSQPPPRSVIGATGVGEAPLPKAPRGLVASPRPLGAPEGAGSVGGGRGVSTRWGGERGWWLWDLDAMGATRRKKTLLPLRRPTSCTNAHSPRGAFGRGLLDPGRATTDRGGGYDQAPPTPRINHLYKTPQTLGEAASWTSDRPLPNPAPRHEIIYATAARS